MGRLVLHGYQLDRSTVFDLTRALVLTKQQQRATVFRVQTNFKRHARSLFVELHCLHGGI